MTDRILPAGDRTAALQSLMRFLEEVWKDKEVRVSAEEYEAPGTPSQNDKMWGMLGDIARQVLWPVNGAMGYLTKEDWKDVLTAGLVREQRVTQGIEGGFVILGRHTSKMSKTQKSALIDLIQHFGDSKQVRWSDPAWNVRVGMAEELERRAHGR